MTDNGLLVKKHIISEIDNIKSDIQDLLDKIRKSDKQDDISKWSELKKKRMDTLKSLNEKLKQIKKQERMETQKQKELRSISRAIDNIEFGAAKKRNNGLAMEKAMQAKAQRDNIRIQYLEYQNMEAKYLEYDSKHVPGCLFLHKDILKSYGLCPFLDIDLDNVNEDTTNEIEKGRLEWLSNQIDNGKLYFKLKDEIFERQDVTRSKTEKQTLEEEISDYVNSILTPSQLEYFNNSTNFIKEYIVCNVKTKRLKEKFKMMINWLSILYSETGIEFHKYLSACYDLQLVVNLLENKLELNNMEKLQRSISIERFEEYTNSYIEKINTIEQQEKYCTNIVKNLKSDFYCYLTDKQYFLSHQDIPSIKKLKISQVGKYFKKWSELTDDEKIERLNSYAEFYVDKNLVADKLLDQSVRDDKITELSNLLNDSFRSKNLLYKHISWNIKLGIIETIRSLRFNDDNTFSLIKKIEDNKNKNRLQKDDKDKLEVDNNNHKRKISVKTVITKDSEKIIHEDLLYFILKRVTVGEVDAESRKEDKDMFIERIKTKLKVKKLTVNDKMKIYEKYDEIFDIIKTNKSN